MEVAEADIGGEVIGVLIALHDIKEGEWFSVAHDDSDEESVGDGEDDDDDDGIMSSFING